MPACREWIAELRQRLRALSRRGEAQRALGLAVLGVCVAGPARAQGTPPGPADAESGGRLLLTLDAQEADYAPEGEGLLRGDVQVWALDPLAPESSQLVLRADEVRADLGAGWLRVPDLVQLWSPRGTLVGRALDWDLTANAFSLRDGRGDVVLGGARAAEPATRLYFTGREIGSREQRETIEHGSVTSCDREHPHYRIDASQVVVDRAAGRAVVRGAQLDLYGFRVPLWPRFSVGLGGQGPRQLPIAWPGYSSRGGYSVPFQRTFTGPDSPLEVRGWLRLQQKAKPEPGLAVRRVWGDVEYGLDWELRRRTYTDLTANNILLGTLPELSASGEWAASGPGRPRVTARLGAGQFRELAAGRAGEVEARRLDLRGELFWGQDARDELDGWWAGLSLRGSAYDDGSSYGAAGASVGRGLALGTSTHLALSYAQALQVGRTPFFFDDTDLRRELTCDLVADVGRDWSVRAKGRYDLDRGRLPDYTVGLARHAHCLTWGLSYESAGRSVYFDLGFNGLNIPLGRYEQQPVVPQPDLPEPPDLVGAPLLAGLGAPPEPTAERATSRASDPPTPAQPAAPRIAVVAGGAQATPIPAPREAAPDEYAQTPANRPRAPDVCLEAPLVDELPPSLGITPDRTRSRS